MTHPGTRHPSVKDIFDSLSACGVDVVALKRSIAFGLLRSRAHAYRAIYDAVKTPRSDVDYSLSPPLRSSVRAACARTQVTFGPATPAPAPAANGHRLMVYRVLTYAFFAFLIKYTNNNYLPTKIQVYIIISKLIQLSIYYTSYVYNII